jgi:nicotinate-nucleotide adenylyltransferase
MAKRKTILFGGTFDPIHLGHTTVAAEAGEYIGAEEIIIIPAKRSPLKEGLPEASDDDRLEMIALAIADKKNFKLSDYELKKAGQSYTLETVRWFQKKYGGDTSIYWLIGADSIDELPHWYDIVELIDECNLSVMYRGGCEQPDFAKFNSLWDPERVEKLQRNIVKTSLIDISSTQIRNLLASGGDAADMLHPSVADYICKHDLYRSKAES